MLTTFSTRPEILFFDAAGTLFQLSQTVGYHYRQVALRHGLDLSAEVLDRGFRAAWKAAQSPATTRQPRVDADKEWWRALVHETLASCVAEGTTPSCQLFEELYLEFTRPGVWQLFPEVGAVLAALQRHFRLGIISNFDGRLRLVLQNLGILSYFDPIVISSEVGADKPDLWIFQRAAELAGCAPSACLHIGDDPACDWQGAAAAGFSSFHLDRSLTSLLPLLEMLEKI